MDQAPPAPPVAEEKLPVDEVPPRVVAPPLEEVPAKELLRPATGIPAIEFPRSPPVVPEMLVEPPTAETVAHEVPP